MIYLDNAATSFHKPDCVPRAVVEAMQHAGNSGRGSSGEAMAASRLIFNTRCQIAEMFDVWGPECVAFTSNDTEALNIALQGTLHPEEETIHAICTEMDHNSVLRPLYRLEKKGMKLTILPADRKGRISLKELEAAIRPETKVIVCTHASNLTGNLNDIHAIGEIAQKHQKLFIVDAAQTAGVFPISMKKDHIDILCFSGHKGLMGPTGHRSHLCPSGGSCGASEGRRKRRPHLSERASAGYAGDTGGRHLEQPWDRRSWRSHQLDYRNWNRTDPKKRAAADVAFL